MSNIKIIKQYYSRRNYNIVFDVYNKKNENKISYMRDSRYLKSIKYINYYHNKKYKIKSTENILPLLLAFKI